MSKNTQTSLSLDEQNQSQTATTFPVTISGRKEPLQGIEGETLLTLFRREGIPIESTCNGKGACGKCAVMAQGELSPPDQPEQRHLDERPAGYRLACRSVIQGPVDVVLDETRSALQTVYTADSDMGTTDSAVRRIDLPEVDPKSDRPYMEGLPFETNHPVVLDQIANWEKTGRPAQGLTYGRELLDVVPKGSRALGAAVDVGTTGLSLYIYDLETGKLLGKSSALNPQTTYGGDVITRIIYCKEEENGLGKLRQVLLDGLIKMMDDALGPDGSRDDIYLVTIAGNTTMLHLLAGVNPMGLAVVPFRPAFLEKLTLTTAISGLPIHPRGRVILLPGASAYIGADIIAGLQAIDYRNQSGLTLFIDIGTNGEMVLFEGPDRMLGASCAVGPALEGMNISCGCRAVPGAIDGFSLDDDLTPCYTTINGAPPVGLCGSGLIELTAALVKAGLLPSRGAFDPNADPRFQTRMKDQAYHLTDQVHLSQKDVRQVQLAKGAVLAGIEILLATAGHVIEDVAQVIVAGSFGYHLDPESLKTIGLLPQNTGKIQFVGNSSLAGAAKALLNHEHLTDLEAIARKIEVIDLAAHPDFQNQFICSLNFPE